MIVAIIVPLYIYYASEQNAALTVRYTASQSLVNINPRNTKDIKVTYNEIEVQNPWFLSLQVENTGNKPIDAKDIKDTLSLTFPSAQILTAQITEQRPPEIQFQLNIAGNTVSLFFDLLNPSDSTSIDILMNGEPYEPNASFRMIGKYYVSQIPFAQKPNQPFITWPRMSMGVQYACLIIATFAAGFTAIMGFTCTLLFAQDFLFWLFPSVGSAKIVRIADKTISNFERNVVAAPPAPVATESKIEQFERQDPAAALGRELWRALPSPADRVIRKSIEDLGPELSRDDLIRRARNFLSSQRAVGDLLSEEKAWNSDMGLFFIGLFFTIAATTSMLVFFGAWQNLIQF